jgi:hypothetical protein
MDVADTATVVAASHTAPAVDMPDGELTAAEQEVMPAAGEPAVTLAALAEQHRQHAVDLVVVAAHVADSPAAAMAAAGVIGKLRVAAA